MVTLGLLITANLLSLILRRGGAKRITGIASERPLQRGERTARSTDTYAVVNKGHRLYGGNLLHIVKVVEHYNSNIQRDSNTASGLDQ